MYSNRLSIASHTTSMAATNCLKFDHLVKQTWGKSHGQMPVVHRNLTPADLYERALLHEKGTMIANNGALVAFSGAKTGRSPLDKRIVKEETTEKNVWWASPNTPSPNFPINETQFAELRNHALKYLTSLANIYMVDGFLNWDKASQIKVRVFSDSPYHALFMYNMLIRPTQDDLATFEDPDFTIFNAGAQQAPSPSSPTSISISFKQKQQVILGTRYAGEMKKGLFTYMHYLMPTKGILSLHSGCNMGYNGDVSLFFGLSGTGKTTLSSDPKRKLIGDDEHCWSDEGVSNIEGGCYAKCINLTRQGEPDIYDAIRFGCILENVDVDIETRIVDYSSAKYTENTRACYPIEHIPNIAVPCTTGHPKNIILLCCDAYGVLPPVSKLTVEQALYHFVNGYTSKIAGTEVGVKHPEATFSACYGGAFLVWHPLKYAAMLYEKIIAHGTQVWLVNTGWTGGEYGIGHRMSLKHTRAIIDAIHDGSLCNAPTSTTPIFQFQVPTECPGVPSELLQPRDTWNDKAHYDKTLKSLAQSFKDNFSMYVGNANHVGMEFLQVILKGGPSI